MAQVTIGIPVYNGEEMIRECLECIQSQSFSDFNVIICDNASTDKTLEICTSFAENDERFKVVSSDKNIGHEANFRKVFELCETEYFMWRADDDYTCAKYLALLLEAISQDESCDLAAPSAVTRTDSETYTGHSTPTTFPELSGYERLSSTLLHYHAAWFYGLWRSSALEKIIDTIWRDFPFAYSRDHLTILRPILANAVITCPEATFIQRTYSPDKGDGMRGTISLERRIDRLNLLMPLFYKAYEDEVRLSIQEKSIKQKLLYFKKTYTFQKLRASQTRIYRLKSKLFLKQIYAKLRAKF